MTSALQKIALVAGALVIAALIGEVVLRATRLPTRTNPGNLPAEWDWIVLDPVLFWVNEPGWSGEHFAINRRGFRGPEIADPKPLGRLRIVCQGDSGTFGIWKKTEEEGGWESYPGELDEILRGRGYANVDVINAGVLGYTSSHGLRQLATQLLALEPDVLTVRFGFNEHALAWEPSLRALEPDSRLARAALYRLSGSRLLRVSLLAHRRMKFLHPTPWSVPWTEPERFERNLRRLVEIGREGRFHVLFVDYPLRPLARGESPGQHPGVWGLLGVEDLAGLHRQHAAYQQIVERVARETGTPLLDTASVCQFSQTSCYHQADLFHLDANGAHETARLLANKLESLGWLQR